ncbi:MAG: hypothetical protein ACOCVR_03835 [Myxococcota bacterium]
MSPLSSPSTTERCRRRSGPVFLWPVVSAALLLCSCRTAGSLENGSGNVLARPLEFGATSFLISYHPQDEAAAALIESSLQYSIPRVTVWGELQHRVHIDILPSHDALESAVGRRGYPWLRAWARFDEVFLQSPATYDLFERGAGNLTELLTHELTHCVMYQRAATREEWRARDRSIPIWFREGMASYTARQGHRRLSEARLVEWREKTGRDPLGEAPALYQRRPEIAYGAAHWAFAFLVERYGARAVRGILDAMYEGRDFHLAFEEVIGLSVRTFREEYLRYLDWGGWMYRERPAPQDVLSP